MVEHEYDFSRWSKLDYYTAGGAKMFDDWDSPAQKREQARTILPVEMSDYDGLRQAYSRQLFMREVEIQGETVYEVIKLQEDLKFHFFYSGVHPGTDDKIPQVWQCVVFYEKKNLPGIVRGLKKIGVDIEKLEEDEVDETTEEVAIQMMLRTSEDWITLLDPWMKTAVQAPEIEDGKVYHYEDSVIKDRGMHKFEG